MVIGGGGREHAIIQKLKENPSVEKLWALPGNGGIARDAEGVNIGAKDLEGILAFAKSHPVDYAVVAPDDPLALGCVDLLTGANSSGKTTYVIAAGQLQWLLYKGPCS